MLCADGLMLLCSTLLTITGWPCAFKAIHMDEDRGLHEVQDVKEGGVGATGQEYTVARLERLR